ncbi:MAG: peptidoglycan bridge formation glycyltransferase FemA/FemB family protein [Desulfobacteraceae bacterium]|nr:peptidoglycan bridge formation glycyltransferase FemA/FemB family protein [Desulfobacteraceae bacterium]
MRTDFFYELDSVKQSEWTEFWRTCQHTHLHQHLLYGEVERARGRTPVYVIGDVDGRIVCIGIFSIRPLFFGKRFSFEAECFWGPVFDDIECAKEFLLQVKSYFKALNVGSIKVCPYWFYPQAEVVESLLNELGFTTTPSVGRPGVRFSTGLIDLNPSKDELLAALKSKTRQEIRRTGRLGVSIRPAENWDEANRFLQHLSTIYRQRSLDYAAVSSKEFKAVFEHILKDGELGVLLIASYDQTFLGGLWIFRGTQTCHYAKYVVVRQTLKKLASLTIAPALWWRGIQWAKDKGCRWIDVEGYRDDLEPYDPRYRYNRFKNRFNPTLAQRIGMHVYVHNRAMHAIRKEYKFCLHKLSVAKALRWQLKSRWRVFKGRRCSGNKPS